MIAHDQLRVLGWSESAIRHRTGSQLHRVHRGVYAVGRPDLEPRGRWMAAVLACGRGAALSHTSAAGLWGLTDAIMAPVHVSVGPGRQARHAGIRCHRRNPMPHSALCDRIPVTEPLATIIDIASGLSVRRIEAIVNEADKRGLFRPEDARRRLERLPSRRGIGKLKRVLDRHLVTDSDLERRFLAIVRSIGLSAPRTQAWVLGYRVDFYWPALGLVVETDGLTYHRTAAQQAKDRRRDQDLTAAGLTCVRFTNAQVRYEKRAVAATLRAVTDRLRG